MAIMLILYYNSVKEYDFEIVVTIILGFFLLSFILGQVFQGRVFLSL